MNKNEIGQSVRDQIIQKKARRDYLTNDVLPDLIPQSNTWVQFNAELNEINSDIESLKKHLGKTDQAIEKIKLKEKQAESESNHELADLLHMQKYVLRLTKHIAHLIESTENGEEDRKNQHFHRLTSRVENISALAVEYDKKYRK